MLSRIRDFYKVGLVYSSNAIEGFSYDETETKILIEDGLTAAGKPLSHALAVIGHAEGYDRMFGLLHRDSISEDDLLMFHACLAGSLDNEARPGEYRNCNIFLTGSDQIFPSPEEVPGRMSDLMASYARNSGKLHPVEAAAKFHAWLTIIHPFADGNGRVARLAANAILIQNGYLPNPIPPMFRKDYIRGLHQAHTNDSFFVEFFADCSLANTKDFSRFLHLDDQPSKPPRDLFQPS